jgi:hypothetical protein
MTRPYSAGNRANIESFREYLEERAIGEGRAALDPTLLNLTPIMLNKFFIHYAKKILGDMDIFLALCKNFINEHCELHKNSVKPIEIMFPFLNWNFIIYREIQKQYSKQGHRPTFRIAQREYNVGEMKVKFPSIFVQGIDSQIVYSYLDFVKEYHENKFPIAVWTNHDCFHICGEYAMLLDIILQDIYSSLSTNTTFIKNLYPDQEKFEAFITNKPPVVCTNPYFIKH